MGTSRKAAALAAVTAVASVVLWPGVPAYADRVRNAEWHIKFLDLPTAQRITKGAGVTVAVVDSGISPHPDLKGNLKKGTDILSGGDGIGQKDTSGHGTSMAGIIAGHGRGANDGVLGIAPEADLLPVKVLSDEDNRDGLPAGIAWAAKAGADVINVSGAGIQSRDLNEAIARSVKADAVVVAAAGNKADVLLFAYPAAMPDVLAVGAIDQNGKLASFSRTGEKVGICAPGVDVASTGLNGKYLLNNGTSAATAVVSGAAALVRAKFPELSAPEVVHRLTATADDFGTPGKDDQCGYGVLNVVKALTAEVPPLPVGATSTGSSTAPDTSAAPNTATSTAPEKKPDAEAASRSRPATSTLASVAGIGALVLGFAVVAAFRVARIRRRHSSR
ncbi:type VII secretion-associated serine protease mycosin [Actinoplanes derwentensis]|uniref:Type VII secretion-associated serine protease mycosin n=1 Tax=Actinoplanes derwentensis TaxID=113562 RepID=A0A1H2D1W7_9ACTN|nr:type VII secretion-associated serine protease mycosin [Actinoplanes derwentensis]GID90007.1 type VII secretion-associated serine protease [Actinoplanes derwentensis]SDT76462.1 type VII secretion-associated serine protease mycosin [Actinoplanes derwentensis]